MNKFQRRGIKLYLKDFTLDMGIPTVGALAWDPATFPEQSEIVFTAGTATDPEKAVIRALTEVAQLGGDFNTKSRFMASGLPKYTTLSQADYVTGVADRTGIDSLPHIGHDNIRLEIEQATEALRRKGFEIYLLDTTHPGLGIPAVYTIMPGAHFRERAKGSSVPFFAAKLMSARSDYDTFTAGLGKLRTLYPQSYFSPFF